MSEPKPQPLSLPVTTAGNPGSENRADPVNASEQAISRAGAARRGPGRPPGSGKKVPPRAPVAPDSPAPGAAPSPLVDPETVKRGIKGILTTVDAAVVQRVSTSAKRISGDAALAAELAGAVHITDGEAENITDLSAVVLAKHQVLGQYAPEVLLGVAMATWLGRLALVFSRLSQMERIVDDERRRRSPIAPAPAAPTPAP